MIVVKLKELLWGAALTFASAAAIIWVAGRPGGVMQTLNPAPPASPMVLLDAGHGGLDGGAVANGVTEAGVNLAITQRTGALLRFFGVEPLLVRPGEESLDYQPEASARANKNADLNARLKLANQYPQSEFLSIHLNKFGQEKYYGAQVFYGLKHQDSPILAETMQEAMRQVLDPENARQAKPAPKEVFLMKHVDAPAVTIECGFLSNAREAGLLTQDVYQTKVAVSIAAGYLNYKEVKEHGN